MQKKKQIPPRDENKNENENKLGERITRCELTYLGLKCDAMEECLFSMQWYA